MEGANYGLGDKIAEQLADQGVDTDLQAGGLADPDVADVDAFEQAMQGLKDADSTSRVGPTDRVPGPAEMMHTHGAEAQGGLGDKFANALSKGAKQFREMHNKVTTSFRDMKINKMMNPGDIMRMQYETGIAKVMTEAVTKVASKIENTARTLMTNQ